MERKRRGVAGEGSELVLTQTVGTPTPVEEADGEWQEDEQQPHCSPRCLRSQKMP